MAPLYNISVECRLQIRNMKRNECSLFTVHLSTLYTYTNIPYNMLHEYKVYKIRAGIFKFVFILFLVAFEFSFFEFVYTITLK